MARKAKTARTERASGSDQVALNELLATTDVVSASASSEPLETIEAPSDSASSEPLETAEEVVLAPDQGESSVTLVGATVLMRSSLWMNGRRTVAGILTAVEETNFGLGDAQAIVSVTAFPPGSPSRTMGDVPLYAEDPGEGVIPAAWLRS